MPVPEAKEFANPEGVFKMCVSTAGLNVYLPAIVGAASILEWGFVPHAKVKTGCWWALEDVPKICDKMIRLIETAKEKLQ